MSLETHNQTPPTEILDARGWDLDAAMQIINNAQPHFNENGSFSHFNSSIGLQALFIPRDSQEQFTTETWADHIETLIVKLQNTYNLDDANTQKVAQALQEVWDYQRGPATFPWPKPTEE